MNDIINDVNELKENILKSSEYLNFKNSEKKLDNNKEVNSIIARIKKLQQTIILLSEPAKAGSKIILITKPQIILWL